MISRLRLLRPLMQFYRPLWPQRRLSSSLINRHEYDFSPILAELPKDSKVASKIMNFAVDLMKKKEREKLDLWKKKNVKNWI
ncbi:hypothetical protein F8M41_000584 [Gigaspora margarita]|uniref:Uncharacterized protein n=1 Tax=Gigaspora margarita TaxID=4874 RepID=A0A8H3XIU5_GIGMA|nr:hypothetical protein F8M41_000584 [Gigaspora margarita]